MVMPRMARRRDCLRTERAVHTLAILDGVHLRVGDRQRHAVLGLEPRAMHRTSARNKLRRIHEVPRATRMHPHVRAACGEVSSRTGMVEMHMGHKDMRD